MSPRALLLPLFLLGCGPEFQVRPQGGVPMATVSTNGVLLTAFADQWSASPYDLAALLTPIAVDLYNGSAVEVRVSFADFALRNREGVRLPALDPFGRPVGSATPLDPAARVAGPILVATRIGAPPSMGSRSGGVRVGPPPGRRFSGPGPGPIFGGRRGFGGYGQRPRWGLGFYLAGGLRGYYGPDALYWSGPWLYGAYGPWVTEWGTGYAAPTEDVLSLALPEGVLAPGAHINGFLYFAKATTTEGQTLDLTWAPHDARTDAALGEVHVALEVVRR